MARRAPIFAGYRGGVVLCPKSYPRRTEDSMQIAKLISPQESYVDSDPYIYGYTTTSSTGSHFITADGKWLLTSDNNYFMVKE